MRIVLLGVLLTGCGAAEAIAGAEREALVSCDPWTLREWSSEAGVAEVKLVGEDDCHVEVTTEKRLDSSIARATASRPLDLTRYAGKRVRLRGEVQSHHRNGVRAGVLGLRAQGPEPRMREADLRDGIAEAWERVELCLDVPASSEALMLTVTQTANADTWLRGWGLEVVGEAVAVDPEVRGLRGVEQVVAFARAFVHLRHFYPAAASQRAWALLAEEGIAIAEAADDGDDSEALARELTRWAAKIGAGIEISNVPMAVTTPDPAGPGWRHSGVAGQINLYKSEFVTNADAASGRVVAALGAGLWIAYPRAFAGQEGPLALAEPPEIDDCAAIDRPRSRRLATTVMMWSVLESFYPYHEAMRTDWEAALRTAISAAAVAAGPQEMVGVLRRMTAELRDNHVRLWYGPEPGCRLPLKWRWIEDRLVITRAPEGHQLRVGDIVETIDGVDVQVRIAAVEAEVSAATPAAQRDLTLRRMQDEPARASTELRVRGADGERTVTLGCVERTLKKEEGEWVRELEDGVLVLTMTWLHRKPGAEELERLARAPGLVVDMRWGASITGLLAHLGEGPIEGLAYAKVVRVYPGPAGRALVAVTDRPILPKQPRFAGPMAFLIDERATSRPESDLAYVHEHRLGAIFGATTAGTTCDVNQQWFPDGFELRWTGCVATWLNGDPFHGVGVPATDPVAPTIAGLRAGRDEVLEAALVWVREQAARRP